MTPTRISRTIIALLAATVAVVGLSAAPASAAQPAKKKPVLTVTVLPGQVRLIDGESIALTLATNLTTGYSWSVLVTGDKGAVKVSKGTYRAPASDLMGAPGQTTWTVKAVGNGVAKVRIVTTPPGGGTAQPVGSLTVYAGSAVAQK